MAKWSLLGRRLPLLIGLPSSRLRRTEQVLAMNDGDLTVTLKLLRAVGAPVREPEGAEGDADIISLAGGGAAAVAAPGEAAAPTPTSPPAEKQDRNDADWWSPQRPPAEEEVAVEVTTTALLVVSQPPPGSEPASDTTRSSGSSGDSGGRQQSAPGPVVPPRATPSQAAEEGRQRKAARRRASAAAGGLRESIRMPLSDLPNAPTIVIHKGDITLWRGDAIVNAANEGMLGGGGVDGAIHGAAGPRLAELCRRVPPFRPGAARCPTGEARTTRSADLAPDVLLVVHTAGPVYNWAAHHASCALLASCYRECARLAKAQGARTVAFPAISCGIFGFPADWAAEVALSVLQEEALGLSEVHFVLFDERTHQTFLRALHTLRSEDPQGFPTAGFWGPPPLARGPALQVTPPGGGGVVLPHQLYPRQPPQQPRRPPPPRAPPPRPQWPFSGLWW